MKTFVDNTQTSWDIELLIGEVERIKEESSGRFNLYDPRTNDLAQKLDFDLEEFWVLLWYLVKDQAPFVVPTADELKRRGNAEAFPGVAGINAKEFGRRMAADNLIAARQVFFEEWRDFFHLIQQPDAAALVEHIIRTHKEAIAKVQAAYRNRTVFKELPGKISRKIDSILNEKFEELQAFLDSTLNDTPGENSGSDTKGCSDTPAQ